MKIFICRQRETEREIEIERKREIEIDRKRKRERERELYIIYYIIIHILRREKNIFLTWPCNDFTE